MKKTILILSALALVLILGAAALLFGLFSGLSGETPQTREMEDWLAESWPLFRLRSWDAQTGALELDYPLRFSYEQMEKYGARIDELRELPASNLSTVSTLKTAALEAAGLTVRSVTVYGVTEDGRTAYTLYPDGSVSACWDAEASAP